MNDLVPNKDGSGKPGAHLFDSVNCPSYAGAKAAWGRKQNSERLHAQAP
ncbi:hypothetical protein [Microvirga makkahensis]